MISPDDMTDYEEIYKEILDIFTSYDSKPNECLTVVSVLLVTFAKTFELSKEYLSETILEIWDVCK